jgi:hypothetical protein
MLKQLWATLQPGREISNRISKEWIEIGFQGADPATDFRAVGILGLKQLLVMCTDIRYKDEALRMYKDSQNQKYWYFFAVAGLNITSKLIISLKSYGGLLPELSDSRISKSATNSNAQMESRDPVQLNQVLIAFYESRQLQGRLFDAMTYIYYKVFVSFNSQWTSQTRSIMEFN